MFGTSQGSAYPGEEKEDRVNACGESRALPRRRAADNGTRNVDADLSRAIESARANIQMTEKLNSESEQRGRTWSIPVPSRLQSRTPIWSGHERWQRQVRGLLNSPMGTQLCQQHNVHPERVYAVAVSMARSADHRTGRRVTASRALLATRAGVSLTVLKRARRVLSALGMAQEMVRGRLLCTLERWAAEAHHGRRQTKGTSVWALVSPKSAAARAEAQQFAPTSALPHTKPPESDLTFPVYPQPQARGPQSLSTSFSACSSVKKNKTTRARARKARRVEPMKLGPRPIALQRAAAEFLNHAPALKALGHIGAACDALRAHSVDTERWSGRDIARMLSEDTKRRGWTWPGAGSLREPLSFLHWRLARIDWSVPSPTERAQAAKELREAERREAIAVADRRAVAAASAETRRASMSSIRKHLSKCR